MEQAKGPLAGIKIIDMTSVIMGPYATRILAGLGADVIKIESPEGDNMRQVGPMRNPGMGHVFLHANQGKRSVVLDLKQPSARQAMLRLLEDADLLISNVRPKAMARLGLAYEDVVQHNPRIIHVSCCGFDQSGPYAARPAYDDLIQGATGIPWLSQQYGAGEPGYAPITLADRVTGLHVVYAVTAALFARERNGHGQAVTVSMYEALTHLVLGDHLCGLSFEPPIGGAGYSRLLTPNRRPYQTSDGYLCVLIYNDKHWRAFFNAIGAPQRMQEPMFSSHTQRGAAIDAVYAEVARLMRERSTQEWRNLLDAADVPNMPMASPQDLLQDPHHQATGFIRRVEHPSEGTLNTIGNPTQWQTDTLATGVRPAPELGQHTLEVLQTLGLSGDELAAMLASRACIQAAPASSANAPACAAPH